MHFHEEFCTFTKFRSYTSRKSDMRTLVEAFFPESSYFLGIPTFFSFEVAGRVASRGCRHTLITRRYESTAPLPWNKKIHPLYKCVTNRRKVAQSLLGGNEQTLPAILSSYFSEHLSSSPFMLNYSFASFKYFSIEFLRFFDSCYVEIQSHFLLRFFLIIMFRNWRFLGLFCLF